MRTKRAASIFLTVFLAFMLPISLFGDDLYRMTLPGVVVENPKAEKGVKEVVLADGTIIKQGYAMLTVPAGVVKEDTIPEDGIPGDKVFLLNETETGCYVTEQVVEIEKKPDGRVEISKGLRKKDMVVFASDRDLVAGEQVKIIEENEQTRLHMARHDKGGENMSSAYLQSCMRRNVLVVAFILFLSVALLVIWKKWIPKRFCFLGYAITVVWCVLICICMKEFIVIPAEWIPRRLIDFREWMDNVRKYPI